MNLHLKALDSAGELIFENSVAIDATHLVAVAESKVPLARSTGRDFTEGAVPFFAAELFNAAQRGADSEELERLSINVSIAAWLADSIYGGVSEDEFVNSNLHFTLLPNGAVKYDRIMRS